jgi:hypothetical protein
VTYVKLSSSAVAAGNPPVTNGSTKWPPVVKRFSVIEVLLRKGS